MAKITTKKGGKPKAEPKPASPEVEDVKIEKSPKADKTAPKPEKSPKVKKAKKTETEKAPQEAETETKQVGRTEICCPNYMFHILFFYSCRP